MKQLTLKSFTGAAWIVGHNFFARGIGVIKTAILARLLLPADFGLFGLAALTVSLWETFSEAGIDQALLQKKSPSAAQISAGWLINAGRNLFLSLGLWLTAPLLARFFNQPELKPLLLAIALVPLIKAFKNPNLVLVQKQMRFRPEFIVRTLATLAETAAAIVVGLAVRNAWALIAAMAANALVTTLASYIVAPPPRLALPSRRELLDLLGFSRWLWGSSLLSYLATQGDDLIVGKLLGTNALGFYQTGYKIASLPATNLSGVIAQVVYPAYALINQDKFRLKRAYLKTLALTTLLSLAGGALIIVFARPLTLILLGANWLPVIPVLKILTIYGTIRAIISTLGAVLTAAGHPEIITYHGLIMVTVMLIIIFPLTLNFGLTGTAWAVVISLVSSQPYLIYKAKQVLSQK